MSRQRDRETEAKTETDRQTDRERQRERESNSGIVDGQNSKTICFVILNKNVKRSINLPQ